MIALMEAHRAGLFKTRAQWINNIIAGVIVGVVALPLGMAFAIASGAKPEQGLYTSIVAGALISVFGGSRVQISGPTGAFIVILAAITAKYGIVGLQIATMMAGVMLLCMGLARMGAVIKFIPAPVIVGFTAGIGVIIWVGQWRDFFGLPKVAGEHFHEKTWHLIQALPELHPATTALALLALCLVIFTPKLPYLKRLPGPLVAMVVATLIQSVFHFDGVATIGSAFGGIPQGLPGFAIPSVTPALLVELVGPAFTIAMLGAIESLLSAVVADGMTGTKHNSNQELVGQGIANIVTPLFGGFAATGAIARTATNIRNGGSSPLAGIVHCIVLLLIVLCLAPAAANIPLAALAAILFVVAYNMSEIRHFKHMLRHAPRADVAILLITFVLTVFTDLVVAVNIGVILATLHFLRRMAASVDVHEVKGEDLTMELKHHGIERLPDDVLVYEVEGPFFYGAVENFARVLGVTHTEPRVLILRLKRVPFIDGTGLRSLEEVCRSLHSRGIRIMLCDACPDVRHALVKSGIAHMLGRGGIYRKLIHAVRSSLSQTDASAQSS
ncbi:SulP family inorganic anion transporter [Craterilacuibacter sinensis]|uniref:STAS domain-containing protein n=1 Tax=Craterilacuibacter sinensis TaxID=2686017 RepID=A0A845BNR9_9NEIS|nr:SulP family inorganic anion transporter [Craterilacuibacter sinensis]MXR36904.1 STAS domain-containing protein [Craterilacuibacter sinensis]